MKDGTVRKMSEPKKNNGKFIGHSTTNDAMPHDLLVAAVNGIASGVAGGVAGALMLDKLKKKPTKTPRRKG